MLTGWGRTAPSRADVVDVDDAFARRSRRVRRCEGRARARPRPVVRGCGAERRWHGRAPRVTARRDPARRVDRARHRPRRCQLRRTAAPPRPAGLLRAGDAGHPLRDARRRHRQRRPRQEPPRRRLVRQPPAVDVDADGRRGDGRAHARSPIRNCGGRRSVGWGSPGSSSKRRSPRCGSRPAAASSTPPGPAISTRSWRRWPRATSSTGTRSPGSTCSPRAGTSGAAC